MLFRRNGDSLAVHTPAKLNLFLEVLGKRSDGYHELETLMVSIDIYDTLVFAGDASNEIRLRCVNASQYVGGRADDSGDDIPDGPGNLVWQAASLLRTHTGVQRGVRIDVHKRIPIAAGLGGGSSNAAATLVALNRLWKLNLSQAELLGLACQLGSDVPFFLAGAPAAVCRGRGEQIEPVRMSLGLHFVVVRPATGLSTALVFRQCQPAQQFKSVRNLTDSLERGRLGCAAGSLHNALQQPAEQLNAEVRQLRTRFSSLSVLGHAMSGSGTAYFGVCAHRRQARSVAARLRAERMGRVFVAQCRP